MNIPLLNEIVIIFTLSIAVVFICSKLHIPAIVGFLLTGILAGPHGLGLVKAVAQVDMLAEIGVVLLVFTTGIEFSFRNLLRFKKSVLVGGFLQVSLTALAVFTIVKSLGQPTPLAIFMGLLLCHTSTTIMLKILHARVELDSPHGRSSLAVSLFQDISSVPMMLCVPIMAGASGDGAAGSTLLWLGLKCTGVIALMYLCAVWIVPKLLYHVARTRIDELFLLTIVAICFAITWLTSAAGLSVALGAFFAGLIISESEYSFRALSNILPFREVFASFFFISMGMLLNLDLVWQQPFTLLLVSLGIMLLKAIFASTAVLLIGFPLRTAIFSGVLLCQVGEFAFILAKTGMPYGLLTDYAYQMLLAIVVITMLLAPFLMQLTPRLVELLLRVPIPARMKIGNVPLEQQARDEKKDHLIIIGFGVNGRNLARAARVSGIPYVILELNAETVKDEKAKGEPIYYGDASQEAVLRHVGISDARVVVIGISDPVASRIMVQLLRRLNPRLHIIVRIRFLQEMKLLYELGANEVIPEELETSVEIFTRVLRKYLIPKDEIAKFIAEVRADNYEMLRSQTPYAASFAELQSHLANIEIITVRLCPASPFADKTLAETNLRKLYGITVLAVRRDQQTWSGPDGEYRLLANDVLIVLGEPGKIAAISTLFGSPMVL
jgi:CPA2 family monovalent cation:H+ antiporter-2